MQNIITADQIRAARALLDWKQSELAEKTGLSLPSINNIERNIGSPRLGTLATIRNTFQSAGIEFIGSIGVQKHSEVFEMHEFQGDDFIEKMNDDLFSCMHSPEDEVVMYGINERMYPTVPEQMFRHYEYQKKTGFSERILLRDNDDFFLSDPHTYRWVPPEILGVIPYYVYKDRLVFIMWETKRVVIIRSEAIADTFRAQFEFLWTIGKKVPPGIHNKLDDPTYRGKFQKKKK